MRIRNNKGIFLKQNQNNFKVENGLAYLLFDYGSFAIIDLNDLERVLKHKWYICKMREKNPNQKPYYRIETKINKKNVRLHRFIIDAKKDEIIDHINQNPFDNRKENLRIVNRSINSRNRKARITSTSKYKGVYFNNERNRWTAQIGVNGKTKHIGHFKTEIDAAKAYDKAIFKFLGHKIGANFE